MSNIGYAPKKVYKLVLMYDSGQITERVFHEKLSAVRIRNKKARNPAVVRTAIVEIDSPFLM